MSVLADLLASHPPMSVAELIDGTAHTGFIEDPRLAWKIASVVAEAERLRPQRTLLEERALRLGRLAGGLLRSRMDVDDLLSLMKIAPTAATHRLLAAWRRRELVILIRTAEDMQRFAQSLSLSAENPLGLYWHKRRRKPVFAIRAPEGDVIECARALVHEWEHHEQSTIEWYPRSPMTTPIDLVHPSGHELLVSEAMAFLEEARWSLVNGRSETWRLYREERLIPSIVASVQEIYFSAEEPWYAAQP